MKVCSHCGYEIPIRSFRLAPQSCPECGESLSRWAAESSASTRSRREISLDAKLMFAYHICMMVLFLVGRQLSVRVEAWLAAIALTIAALISLFHRQRAGWKWPGVSVVNVLAALAALALGGVFLLSATPLFPPNSPAALPWYLAGAGIILFSVLSSLKVVVPSKEEFLKCCTTSGTEKSLQPAASEQPSEATWKRIARVVFSVFFLAVWLEGVAFFYYFGVTYRDGSPQPTATQTAELSNHGRVVYVTPSQQHYIQLLQLGMMIGIPTGIVTAFFLHFVLGVRMWQRV